MDSFEKESLRATDPSTQDVLGIAALVADSQGRTLYSHFSGRQTLEAGSPSLNLDTTVSLVSAGKFLTHIAALQLVDQGLIRLDDPIHKLLPELKDVPVITADVDPSGPGYALRPSIRPITLRHMLTNCSGIMGYEGSLLQAWRAHGKQPEFPEDTSPIIKKLWCPLLFDPGESWNYGHDVHFLQVVVERASKQKFVNYQQTHIFDTLDMKASTYGPDTHEVVRRDRLQLVERGADGKLGPAPEGSVWGLTCSMANLQTLFSDLISPSPVLLSRETRAIIFEPGLASSSAALKAFEAEANKYAAQVGIPKDQKSPPANYSCAGAMLVEGDAEDGSRLNCPPGTLTWDGMPNIAWAVNLDKGLAMIFATQLLQEYDAKTMPPRMEFFKSAWAAFGRDIGGG